MNPATRLCGQPSAAACFTLLGIILTTAPAFADENWPMWRYDSHRSAASPNSLPDQWDVVWKQTYGERQPVWDDPLNRDLMNYDSQLEPIVLDGRMILAFNDQDKVVALDTATGASLWTFFTDAPVRLPPVGWRDRVLFCSDDGFLYCLKAESGQLLWRVRGGPNAQKALGNRRLISAWPARGGPVIWENTVYFAASIWPFMGTFIYAIDMETGQVQWVNDNTGAQYIKQPHSAPSFAGVGPQGALVATQDYLIVPGGRSVPAVFQRQDGQFVHFEINSGGKGTGGAFVAADDVHFYVHTREKGTRAMKTETGIKTAFTPNEPVILGDVLYAAAESNGVAQIHAYRASLDDDKIREPLWKLDVPAMEDLIAAGPCLVAAGNGIISIVRQPVWEGDSLVGGAVEKQLKVEEPLARLLVADHKLFAVARSGTLYAFGPESKLAATASGVDSGKTEDTVNAGAGLDAAASATALQPGSVDSFAGASDPQAVELVQQMLAAGDAEGYALWFGPCSPSTLAAWARLSPFVQLAIVDSDAERVAEGRKHLDLLGAYGKITLHCSEPTEFRAPVYIANQVFVATELAQKATEKQLESIYASVRPYGGCMVLAGSVQDSEGLLGQLQSLGLEQAELNLKSGLVIARRVGPLPGAADWTHQHADIANSVKSNDSRVRLPLGILWFGGSSNMDVLPRHGHGPPQQVVGGRLIIQGMNSLSARDVYTGRILWHRQFDDLGTFDVYYDATYENTPLDPKYNQVHIPGANARGTNYVVTEDRIYLAVGNRCKMLDTKTGEDVGEIFLPKDDQGDDPEWGFIGIYEDVLLGGIGFAKYRQRLGLEFESDKLLTGSKAGFGSKSLDRAASRALVGFHRHSGQMLWRIDANHSFWHNGIVAGGGKVFCLDRNPSLVEEALKRRGAVNPNTYRILAVDVRTGEQLWQVREGIFGTWLGYSQQYDLLLQAGARASDRLADEVGKGMRVYNAADGSVRWAQDDLAYNGPCILHHNWIITNTNAYSVSSGAYDIRTGQQRMTINPITGQPQPWQITRTYGCNKIIASENLLTFRSGAAGFYDLSNDSGTGNWGGFKSGCTSNLIVANGVLNAPDYTRTCSCSYQNQTSLALVHMPDMDQWTINLSAIQADKDVDIDQVGVNLGAPGDRRDPQGVLWIEHPNVAGDAAPLSIQLNEGVTYYQQHSSTFSDSSMPWVLASGALGIRELRVKLKTQEVPRPSKDSESKVSGDSEGTPVDVSVDSFIENQQQEPVLYDIDLYFGLPKQLAGLEKNVFEVSLPTAGLSASVSLPSEREVERLDNSLIATQQTSSSQTTHSVQRFRNVPLKGELAIAFNPQQGTPFLSGIRVVRSAEQHEKASLPTKLP